MFLWWWAVFQMGLRGWGVQTYPVALGGVTVLLGISWRPEHIQGCPEDEIEMGRTATEVRRQLDVKSQ